MSRTGKNWCGGELTVTNVEVVSRVVEPTKDGDLNIVGAPEPMNVIEGYSLKCDKCGYLGGNRLARHGVADDWQVL